MSGDQQKFVKVLQRHLTAVGLGDRAQSTAVVPTPWDDYLGVVEARLNLTHGAVQDFSLQIGALFRGEGEFSSVDEAFEHFAARIAQDLRVISESFKALRACAPLVPVEQPWIRPDEAFGAHQLLVESHADVLNFTLALLDRIGQARPGQAIDLVIPSEKLELAAERIHALARNQECPAPRASSGRPLLPQHTTQNVGLGGYALVAIVIVSAFWLAGKCN